MSDPARPEHIDFSAFDAALRSKAAEREAARRGPPVPTAIASHSLTEVELTWIEKKLEHWIRFGRIAQDRILTRRTRVVSFRPGAIFAFVRWTANDYGTIVSRIDIARTVAPGEPYTTLPFVRPGGDILLHIEGWPKVQKVLAAIDAVEAAGVDPCDAAADHWRHVHNRIAAGHQPRPYTMERHRAWLKRREIEG
ncbi:MAG: glycosidase [Alphaproteobacteria bacterium HGW-Alphaproteobacteria-13]|nr:MAG: glycosidase [Alphaproteobacteria bacterium HGW-Alphaproteobacteria-13]